MVRKIFREDHAEIKAMELVTIKGSLTRSIISRQSANPVRHWSVPGPDVAHFKTVWLETILHQPDLLGADDVLHPARNDEAGRLREFNGGQYFATTGPPKR